MSINSFPPASATYAPGQTLHSRAPHTESKPGGQGAASDRSVAIPSTQLSSTGDARQSAMALVDRTLSDAYKKMGFNVARTPSTVPLHEPLTAEKVADNILGFIARRLHADVAEGATAEQLEKRLAAGLAGFNKGFAEASEKLKALNLLSPAIQQDIGKTYELVTEGIDRLKQQFVGALQAPTISPAPAQQIPASFSAGYQYRSASHFFFDLTTVEGDRVTISVASMQAYNAHTAVRNDRGDSSLTTQVQATSRDTAGWSVQGDLNEQEMQAIEKLLGQVNNLAKQFFSGNLDQAFEQALALGYDTQQIAAFSLNLTQVEVQRAHTTYQAVHEPSLSAVNLAERLMPMGQFVKQLLESLDELSIFPQREQLLLAVAANMVAPDAQQNAQPAQRFETFIKSIFAGLSPE